MFVLSAGVASLARGVLSCLYLKTAVPCYRLCMQFQQPAEGFNTVPVGCLTRGLSMPNPALEVCLLSCQPSLRTCVYRSVGLFPATPPVKLAAY